MAATFSVAAAFAAATRTSSFFANESSNRLVFPGLFLMCSTTTVVLLPNLGQRMGVDRYSMLAMLFALLHETAKRPGRHARSCCSCLLDCVARHTVNHKRARRKDHPAPQQEGPSVISRRLLT